MNIVTGMIVPDTNCAPKLARYSSSFFSWNAASTSCCRPNTFTSSCPVNASSMSALSAPVCCHCAMNSGCERFAICRVATTDSGTATSAITASSGEIENIRISTPTIVSSDVSSPLSVCCRVWATLSMSFVTRLSSSPRGCPSKYSSGSRLSFSSASRRSSRTTDWVTPVSRKPCSQSSTLDPTNSSSASSSTCESWVKSTPSPGTGLAVASRFAWLSSPCARSCAITSGSGTPGGSFRPR